MQTFVYLESCLGSILSYSSYFNKALRHLLRAYFLKMVRAPLWWILLGYITLYHTRRGLFNTTPAPPTHNPLDFTTIATPFLANKAMGMALSHIILQGLNRMQTRFPWWPLCIPETLVATPLWLARSIVCLPSAAPLCVSVFTVLRTWPAGSNHRVTVTALNQEKCPVASIQSHYSEQRRKVHQSQAHN